VQQIKEVDIIYERLVITQIFNDIIVYVYKMHVRMQSDLDVCKIILKNLISCVLKISLDSSHRVSVILGPTILLRRGCDEGLVPHVLHFQHPFVLRRIGRGR